MNMKWTIRIVLLAAALTVPLGAQTLSEQLQKGIYTEETLGDRVEAARIYRQIIAAPAVPRSIAQDAERRLARLTASQRPSVPGVVILPPSDQPTVILPDDKRCRRERPISPLLVRHHVRSSARLDRQRDLSFVRWRRHGDADGGGDQTVHQCLDD